GGGTGGDSGTRDGAVLEEHLDLDGRVASGVEDLAGADGLDSRHGELLRGMSVGAGARRRSCRRPASASRHPRTSPPPPPAAVSRIPAAAMSKMQEFRMLSPAGAGSPSATRPNSPAFSTMRGPGKRWAAARRRASGEG